MYEGAISSIPATGFSKISKRPEFEGDPDNLNCGSSHEAWWNDEVGRQGGRTWMIEDCSE